MTVGTRYRLVTDQGQERHVSSVVLGADEVGHHVLFEAALHQMAGWDVRVVADDDSLLLFCFLNGTRRLIRAWPFDPFTDVVR